MSKINYSIASLPITLCMPLIPHWYTVLLVMRTNLNGGWPNENPRSFVAYLNAKAATGKKLNDMEKLVLRGQAAQMNGWEWWPVWATAVILGYLAKIESAHMQRLTVFHVACRAVFNWLFLATTNRALSYLRTLVFFLSMVPPVTIFLEAAYALAY